MPYGDCTGPVNGKGRRGRRWRDRINPRSSGDGYGGWFMDNLAGYGMGPRRGFGGGKGKGRRGRRRGGMW